MRESERDAKDEAARVTKPFEGTRLKPYLCPAGVPTIGTGATFYQDGTKVTMSDKSITEDEADQLLRYQLVKFELGVRRALPGVNLTPYQLGACIDFAFNMGLGAFRSSTLRKRILKGQFDDVPYQFSRWVFAGGRKLNGLIRRREADGLLFNDNL